MAIICSFVALMHYSRMKCCPYSASAAHLWSLEDYCHGVSIYIHPSLKFKFKDFMNLQGLYGDGNCMAIVLDRRSARQRLYCKSTKFCVRFNFANFAFLPNVQNYISACKILWGSVSSFRNNLNFENRTIIKGVKATFVKQGWPENAKFNSAK